MSRDTSPFTYADYWLDKRKDGLSPHIWQIAHLDNRSIVYRSTRKRELADAIAVMEAFVAQERGETKQENNEAEIAVILVKYWTERGRNLINYDQTQRSLYLFLGFLLQDKATVHATVADLTPLLFERFRAWRMGPHAFEITWFGKDIQFSSKGVCGATVQRSINDIRAAVHHAEKQMRITAAPKIADIDARYRSPPKDRILTEDELARIVWYAAHNKDLFRFVVLQIATAVRPVAAMQFDPRTQYDDRSGLIDLQPKATPYTKKRNAILPAIRPLRVVLRAWAKDEVTFVTSHKTAWRNMRRVLELSDDVHPKTIRYTIATWLYEMDDVPERQISEMLGHTSDSQGLARTSRVYAKHRPEKMGKVTAALTSIWRRVSLKAREFGADHVQTIYSGVGPSKIVKREKFAANSNGYPVSGRVAQW